MILFCQKISQDHVTKGSRNIMDRSPLRLVAILSSLMAIANVVTE